MMETWIVMRSHNDMPWIQETLGMLARQKSPYKLLVLDNDSTDGTAEAVKKHSDKIINVPKGMYKPGRVLNQGMEATQGEFVVFLNSDCVPQDEWWLQNLLSGFADEKTAAVFGRQIPRPDCHAIYARDTEETFGDGKRQQAWRHCFSMASSVIRRSVWEKMPFDEKLQYSEDIDWTWRARQLGYEIRYVPEAVVTHSHNYTWKQYHKRHYGEGRAEAFIFEWSFWQQSFLRYSFLPYARQVVSDWKYCLRRRELAALFSSPVLRLAQLLGRRAGFRAGIKERMA